MVFKKYLYHYNKKSRGIVCFIFLIKLVNPLMADVLFVGVFDLYAELPKMVVGMFIH